MALIARTYKPKAHDISKVECLNCHEIRHLASQCRKKKDSAAPYCCYCKKDGHVIENCRKRPPRQNFKAYVASSSSNGTVAAVPSDSSDNNSGQCSTLSPKLCNKTFKLFMPLVLDLRTGKVIGTSHRKGELFVLDLGHSSNSATCLLASSSNDMNSTNKLWQLWDHSPVKLSSSATTKWHN
eukprot:XP_015581203.1 uncharacterized protein LOC107262094 [Ricinus communis]